MLRDFTFIDDVVEGLLSIIGRVPERLSDGARYEVYNLGNSSPVSLLQFVDTLERLLMEEGLMASPAQREFLPMQKGDVMETFADTTHLVDHFGFSPNTSVEDGLRSFVLWYKDFYKIG